MNEGDKIAVCISGGKDSMLMAKLFQELQRHSKVKFELVFLVMDPGYNEINRQKIETTQSFYTSRSRFLRRMSLRLPIRAKKSVLSMCTHAPGAIYTARHRSLAATKLPLGHHFSDVIETPVMSMFYGGQLQAMLPKLHSKTSMAWS